MRTITVLVDGEEREIEAVTSTEVSDQKLAEVQARRVAKSREVPAIVFFNLFTDEERVAVMMACQSSPELNVGMVNGLAAGSVTLDSPKLEAWLGGLVSAGAITEERKSEIQNAV